MSALRVLVLVAAPRDAMTFDAEKAWSDLAAAVKPFEAQGRLVIERVVPATENALKKSLAAATWDVVHVIANANWRVAAQYGTVILESSTGASRGVSTQYLGEILQRARLVVLQTAVAGMTWDDGPALLMNTGPVVDPSQATFARSFYASLITGSTIEAAAAHARASLAASGASCEEKTAMSFRRRHPSRSKRPRPSSARIRSASSSIANVRLRSSTSSSATTRPINRASANSPTPSNGEAFSPGSTSASCRRDNRGSRCSNGRSNVSAPRQYWLAARASGLGNSRSSTVFYARSSIAAAR